ncbi:MAG TPA: hypothetical protein VFW96_18610, partial [Thermomicrobiales bacterium]|nr:hypothetical protein [Thermomicrobiales bacterium]
AAPAGARTAVDVLATAREVGAAVWCAAPGIGALPAPVAAALRALAPAVLVRDPDPEGLDAVARWLGLTAPRFRGPDRTAAGGAVLLRGDRCEALRALLEPAAAPRALPRDGHAARHVGRPRRRAAGGR